VTADLAGNIYVADVNNLRVRKLAPPPVYLASVINAASLLPGPAPPGEIVIISGNGLGPTQAIAPQADDSGVLATTLGGTQVMFDGIAAPLLSVQANQITAIVPYEVAGEASTQVQVIASGNQTNMVSLPLQVAAPAIFTQNSSGSGPGAILNSDSTMNSPSNPAARGSIVTINATGEGLTEPPGVDGLLASSSPPMPLQSVSVQIGDAIDATVMQAGGVPGLAAGFSR
jgi:uncharacterized protein (TIGR03437 family)